MTGDEEMHEHTTQSDSDDPVVSLKLTVSEAEDLLAYTETSLSGDDSYDEMRERLVSVCDKLRRVL